MFSCWIWTEIVFTGDDMVELCVLIFQFIRQSEMRFLQPLKRADVRMNQRRKGVSICEVFTLLKPAFSQQKEVAGKVRRKGKFEQTVICVRNVCLEVSAMGPNEGWRAKHSLFFLQWEKEKAPTCVLCFLRHAVLVHDIHRKCVKKTK